MFIYHTPDRRDPRYVATRDDWLDALKRGLHNPKPPDWWLASQEREEHRPRRQASIIWSRYYDRGRKYLIWSQAPDSDFIRLGYMEG